jgi:Glyoxalase-like domain
LPAAEYPVRGDAAAMSNLARGVPPYKAWRMRCLEELPMAVRLTALEIDALSPAVLAGFWSRMLDRDASPAEAVLPGRHDADFAIRFVRTSTPKTALHRMHFDLTSASAEDQRRIVELALELGARHFDVGQRGDEGHVVLADPEGNEFCVIEPDNDFLAGTARIGALAGDGLREVGYFWKQALGWPLVWDQDGQTAIQSPAGGTKITWGGPPVAAKRDRNRLRWVLTSRQPLDGEIDRLLDLGARLLGRTTDRAELADPEGNEFAIDQAPD